MVFLTVTIDFSLASAKCESATSYINPYNNKQ